MNKRKDLSNDFEVHVALPGAISADWSLKEQRAVRNRVFRSVAILRPGGIVNVLERR